MPELPEVETARRIIERCVVGASLVAVEVRLEKMLRLSPLSDIGILIGKELLAARRRAKLLILDWSDGLAMLIHLKLSGQVSAQCGDLRQTAGHPIPDPQGPYPHKTTHVTLTFDNGYDLHLSDLRQFGWIRIMPEADVAVFLEGQRFGPEANGPDGISVEDLAAKLARRSIPIKLALLDQTVVAGIGNIYVDEALHRAKIHPSLPANRLTPDRIGPCRGHSLGNRHRHQPGRCPDHSQQGIPD